MLSLAASVDDAQMNLMRQIISLEEESAKAASEALKVESAVKLEKMALAKRFAKEMGEKNREQSNSIGSSAVNTPQELSKKEYIVVF